LSIYNDNTIAPPHPMATDDGLTQQGTGNRQLLLQG